jgi:hypothetical protein
MMSLPEGIIVYDKELTESGATLATNKQQTESVYSSQTVVDSVTDNQMRIGVTFFNQSAEKLTGLNFETIMKQYTDERDIYGREEVDKFY